MRVTLHKNFATFLRVGVQPIWHNTSMGYPALSYLTLSELLVFKGSQVIIR